MVIAQDEAPRGVILPVQGSGTWVTYDSDPYKQPMTVPGLNRKERRAQLSRERRDRKRRLRHIGGS